jgi:hypothetical protein
MGELKGKVKVMAVVGWVLGWRFLFKPGIIAIKFPRWYLWIFPDQLDSIAMRVANELRLMTAVSGRSIFVNTSPRQQDDSDYITIVGADGIATRRKVNHG